MNKKRLIFLLFVLLLSLVRSSPYAVPPLDPANYVLSIKNDCWIPIDYYDSPPIIPSDMSLERWLSLITWTKKYEANKFDCSQMSAFLEWALDNAGYSTRFFVGYGHCWLSIKVDDEWVSYESTRLVWIPETDEYIAHYRPQRVFSNLHVVKAWYQRAVWAGAYTKSGAKTIFLREFGWWIQEEE